MPCCPLLEALGTSTGKRRPDAGESNPIIIIPYDSQQKVTAKTIPNASFYISAPGLSFYNFKVFPSKWSFGNVLSFAKLSPAQGGQTALPIVLGCRDTRMEGRVHAEGPAVVHCDPARSTW
jgi:hypothetical protein